MSPGLGGDHKLASATHKATGHPCNAEGPLKPARPSPSPPPGWGLTGHQVSRPSECMWGSSGHPERARCGAPHPGLSPPCWAERGRGHASSKGLSSALHSGTVRATNTGDHLETGLSGLVSKPRVTWMPLPPSHLAHVVIVTKDGACSPACEVPHALEALLRSLLTSTGTLEQRAPSPAPEKSQARGTPTNE